MNMLNNNVPRWRHGGTPGDTLKEVERIMHMLPIMQA